MNDAVSSQGRENPQERLLSDVCVLGQVRRAMGDLRSGWSDQVREHAGGHVLLLGVETRQGSVEMVAHDRRGASEPAQGLEAEER